MLYNIPGRTGCNLLPLTVNKLMNFPNILSIKAASGRIEEVTELRAECGSKLSIYSGDDSLLLPMLSVGAVDYELAIKLSNYLCENGSDGIVLCGTTGESPTLSWAEQHNLFVAVKGVSLIHI